MKLKSHSIYSFPSLKIFLCAFLIGTPALSWACGGLFCNVSQPVTQSAERILFAPDHQDPNRIQMHVQIQYAGPPADFSWMLPVPTDTDFAISTDRLFGVLDNQYAPIFRLNRVFPDECQVDFASGAPQANSAEGGGGARRAPQVQVLSREIVGPYDKVVLTADTVGVLTEWLTENGYQVPDRAEEVLSPYLEDFAFIAIRLTPAEGVDSIKPISLTFTSPAPSIPIIPTSVAAQPDMGILVHLLGSTRAVSTNYAHVRINEAVIDWNNSGANYPDVVSQAIDEAGGQAFVTDFAGNHGLTSEWLININSAQMERIEQAQNIKQAIEAGVLTFVSHVDYGDPIVENSAVPEDQWTEVVDCWNLINPQDFGFYGDYDIPTDEERQNCEMVLENEETTFDGQAVANALREVNVIYENIETLFNQNPYITRLYSTLSAEEMNLDPSFNYNSDLGDVEQTRQADLQLDCEGNQIELVLSNGTVVDVSEDAMPEFIQRQDGETVRGANEIAAQIIERQMPAGQPELIEDRTAMIQKVEEDDSGCQSSRQPLAGVVGLLFIALLGWRRRLLKA